MSDPGAAFHIAQEEALRTSPPLILLFAPEAVRVFSVVPQNAPMPFIRIGDDQIVYDGDECLDGSEIFGIVHLWTKPEPPGVELGRLMAGAIRSTLAVELPIAGHETLLWEFVDTRMLTDPDGSSHAVLTFRYLTTPLTAPAQLPV